MPGLAKEIIQSQRSVRSIAWLARELGIERSGLSRRLDGTYKWKPGEVEKVARLLGVPIEVVIDRREPTEVA